MVLAARGNGARGAFFLRQAADVVLEGGGFTRNIGAGR